MEMVGDLGPVTDDHATQSKPKVTGEKPRIAAAEPARHGLASHMRRMSASFAASIFATKEPMNEEGAEEASLSTVTRVMRRGSQVLQDFAARMTNDPNLAADGSDDGAPRLPMFSRVGTKEYRAEAWAAAVHRCILMQPLAPAEIEFVCGATKVIKVQKNDVIFNQGDVPTMMYLVHSGRFEASCNLPGGGSWKAREYDAFDSFGACEMLDAQMLSQGRSCNVVALTNGVVWGIPRRLVELKMRVPPPARPGMDVTALQNFTRHLKMFNSLSDERLAQLNRCAVQMELEANECICYEGDLARDIYAIFHGSLYTSQAGSDFSMTMKAPMTFGESAFLYDEVARTRQARVCAGSDGATIIRWPVNEIETLVGFELHAASERLFTIKFFEPIKCGVRPFTKGLSDDQITQLVGLMTTRSFSDGEMVLPDNKLDEHIYFVKSGKAIVSLDSKKVAREKGAEQIALLQKCDCFGEQALATLFQEENGGSKKSSIKVHKRWMNVVADGDLVVWSLSPAGVRGIDDLKPWLDQLMRDVINDFLPGVDAVVMQRAQQDGIDMGALLAKPPKGKGKGGKEGKTKG